MTEIFLDGVIGYDVFASDIRKQFKEAKNKDIKMLISSPGGFISEGLAISNIMRQYEGKINVEITGEAASMATYIAMFGDTVNVFDNSVFMIHNAFGGVLGDFRDIKQYAEMLESLTKMLANAYANKTGKSVDDIRTMMNNETFLFGSEIKEMGFADITIESKKDFNDEARAEKITETRMLIENAKDIIKEFKKDDFEKAAALLKPVENAQKPAETGHIINQEVTKMTLTEFLKSDPVAQQEYNNALAKAEKTGTEKVQNRIDKASVYMTDSYTPKVHDIAIKAMKGERSIEHLEDVVALADELSEKVKSQLAQEETEQIGETKAEQKENLTEDGSVKTEDDFQAMKSRIGGIA